MDDENWYDSGWSRISSENCRFYKHVMPLASGCNGNADTTKNKTTKYKARLPYFVGGNAGFKLIIKFYDAKSIF